jgi:uncharacterized membrane protein
MSNSSWIKKESAVWADKGIISREQAQQITALYPADNKNRFISTVLVLGAILLGAGIILFFASNWQAIPKWFKVGLVIVPLIMFHLLAQVTSNNYPKISSTLTMLGCIMFGAGIWLIAQIFHINSHFPNGILFWMLGVLPVAWFLQEKFPLVLSAILLGIWVVAEQSSAPMVMLTGALLLAIVFYLTYKMQSPFALAISLISAVVFLCTEIYLLYDPVYRSLDAVFLIPLVLLMIGQVLAHLANHQINRSGCFAQIYSTLSVLVVGISLFLMSFEYFANSFYELHQGDVSKGPIWVLYIISALASAYLITRDNGEIKEVLRGNFIWLLLDALVFIMLLIPIQETLLMIVLNVMLFVYALSIIVLGYQLKDDIIFTLGLVGFNLYLITEYFNLFWQALPKSLFFMVGGIVLIVGGSMMEYQRRKVIKSWQDNGGNKR